MRPVLICICLVFSACLLKAQEFKLINSIPFAKGTSFTTDNLGNTYVIAENQLLQFDQYGKPKANYSDRSSGRLKSIDVSNPLKILLFYPDFLQLKILNSKLSIESTIELRNLGFLQPTAATQSSKDGYWVYDLQDSQLKKINLGLQIQYQSGNLNQILGYSPTPDYIVEKDNFLYLNNPKTGILVFDQFGVYTKTIPFTDLKTFQPVENTLLFVDKNKFWKYSTKTLQQTEVLIPPHDSLVNARIEQDKLFLLTIAHLHFYSY